MKSVFRTILSKNGLLIFEKPCHYKISNFAFWGNYSKTSKMQKYYFYSITLFEHAFSINNSCVFFYYFRYSSDAKSVFSKRVSNIAISVRNAVAILVPPLPSIGNSLLTSWIMMRHSFCFEYGVRSLIKQ